MYDNWNWIKISAVLKSGKKVDFFDRNIKSRIKSIEIIFRNRDTVVTCKGWKPISEFNVYDFNPRCATSDLW